MELKHINREISQLATMEATNYISERGLEKLKEFRYLRGLHEEKVKKLTIPNVSNNEVALKAFVEEYVEAWEDGMGGDTDLYRKAKSLL